MADEDQVTEDLQEVVAVARDAVEQEFHVAERLDAKARGQVTLAGQWFAVVQAVSAVALGAKGVSNGWLYALGIAAVVGALLLVATFVQSAKVWRIRSEAGVAPQGIFDLRDTARDPNAETLDVAITHHASILQDRRKTNKDRVDELETAESLWQIAMAVALVQLAIALAARVLG